MHINIIVLNSVVDFRNALMMDAFAAVDVDTEFPVIYGI